MSLRLIGLLRKSISFPPLIVFLLEFTRFRRKRMREIILSTPASVCLPGYMMAIIAPLLRMAGLTTVKFITRLSRLPDRGER